MPPGDPQTPWIIEPRPWQRAHDLGSIHSLDRLFAVVLGDEQGSATAAIAFNLLSPQGFEIERVEGNPFDMAWIDIHLLDASRSIHAPDGGDGFRLYSWRDLPQGRWIVQASSRLWRAASLRFRLRTTGTTTLTAS